MSGYTELRDAGATFRPFDGDKPRPGGTPSRFDAPWEDTCSLLARELRHLNARSIVVELDLQERDLRLDGLPRADARLASDAVRISFESKWGPQRIETAEFTGTWGSLGWQANLRAIALGLEALRKIDRYGISKRGEQYRGWRQIPQNVGDPTDKIVTTDDALEVVSRALGSVGDAVERDVRDAVRRAIRATHPDTGGDATEFRKVMKAKEVLGV